MEFVGQVFGYFVHHLILICDDFINNFVIVLLPLNLERVCKGNLALNHDSLDNSVFFFVGSAEMVNLYSAEVFFISLPNYLQEFFFKLFILEIPVVLFQFHVIFYYFRHIHILFQSFCGSGPIDSHLTAGILSILSC